MKSRMNVGVLGLLVGMGTLSACDGEVRDTEVVGTTEAILGAPVYAGTPPAGTELLMNTIHRELALAVSSQGFAWCVSEAMRNGVEIYGNVHGPYIGCSPSAPDPFQDAKLEEQIARVLDAARSGLRSTLSFSTEKGALAMAKLGVYGDPEKLTWLLWDQARVDEFLARCIEPDGSFDRDDCDMLAGTWAHEVMHSHGYMHAPSCAQPGVPGWNDSATIPRIVGSCVAGAVAATSCGQVTCAEGERAIPTRFNFNGHPVPYECVCTRPDAQANLPEAVARGSMPAHGFTQGSPAATPCRHDNEDPHAVSFTRSFELMTTEVTQGAFEARMGYNPSSNKACGANCPVENVTWHEAVSYCNALNEDHGLRPCFQCTGTGAATSCTPLPAYQGSGLSACRSFRLPTEAEWEAAYYARGASTNPFYRSGPQTCGTEFDANAAAAAWYAGSKLGRYTVLQPVAQKEPNAIGLYDMAGNVVEWVADTYVNWLGTGARVDPNLSNADAYYVNKRVMKGGYYASSLDGIRGQRRYYDDMNRRSPVVGFRCARSSM